MTDIPIRNFRKLESPFERVMLNKNRSIVTPVLNPEYAWFLEDGVRAVDKLDGTNVCVYIDNSRFKVIDNRKNRLVDMSDIRINRDKMAYRALMGLFNSAEKGYTKHLKDGYHYGELIGPGINGNMHSLKEWLWVPFSWLQENCHWNTWVSNKYEKTFESISDWFMTLPSLFNARIGTKASYGEGVVFTHPDGRMCKLRRDMFDWYEGAKHKAQKYENAA